MSDPITTTTPPAAPAPTAPSSFADFLDKAISEADFTPAPAPATPAAPDPAAPAPVAVDPAAPPAFVVPDAVTKQITAPPAAPATPDPAADDTAIDDIFKTKPGEAFSKLKRDLRELRRTSAEEAAALKAQIEAAKTSSVPTEEVERLKQDAIEARKINAEYERELTLVKVEATREYKETVTKRLETINGTVKEIADKYKVSERDVLGALQETDSARQDTVLADLAANFSERDRMKLYGMIDQYAAVAAQDKFVKENATTALKVIEERRQLELAAARQSSSSEYNSALDSAWNELQGNFNFFKPVEGNPEWNNTLTEMNKYARELDIEKLTPAERAHLVYQGVSMPLMARALTYYAGELQTLRAAQAAKAGVLPGAGAGNPAPAPAASAVADSVGFLDAIEQMVAM